MAFCQNNLASVVNLECLIILALMRENKLKNLKVAERQTVRALSSLQSNSSAMLNQIAQMTQIQPIGKI